MQSRNRRGLLLGVAGLLLAAVATVAVAALLAGRSDDQPQAESANREPQAAARIPVPGSATLAWLRDSTVPGTTLAVPATLRRAVAAALPGRDVRGYAEQSRPDLVLVARPGPAVPQPLLDRSVTVATLGPGLDLRQVLESGTSWVTELAARRAAGRELVQNDALTLTAPATAVIRRGELDPRLLTVLAGLALEHRIFVDVPADSPARSIGLAVRIVLVDGRSVSRYAWGAAIVKAFLDVQSPIFTPGDVALDRTSPGPDALVVRYPFPTPTGLLGGAGFRTTG